MKILIVEDESVMAKMIEALVQPLLLRFPGSEITFVQHFESARRIVNQDPAPDCIILDLSLLDSTLEETIARIPELHTRSAIVICSGHSRHLYEKMIPQGIEIIEKQEIHKDASLLSRAIVRVIAEWQRPKFDKMRQITEEIRAIQKEANSHAPNTQG